MQNKLIFLGCIHPKRVAITIAKTHQDLYLASGKNIGKFSVEVNASDLTAVLELEEPNDQNYETWGNSLLPRISAIIDTFGFLTGGGYEVELTKVIDINKGEVFSFPTYLNILPRCNSQNELEDKFFLILELLKNKEGAYFQSCLSELRKSLRFPFESAVHAFKAIEAIRQIYGARNNLDPKKQRDKAWEILRSNLGIEKSEISEKIQIYSDPIRHGEIREFTQDERTEILQAAWNIVHLYVDKMRETISNKQEQQ